MYCPFANSQLRKVKFFSMRSYAYLHRYTQIRIYTGQIGLKFLRLPQPILFVTVVANLNPYPSTAMAYLLKYQYIWNIDFCESKILPNKYAYYLTIYHNNHQIENLHFQTESPFQVAIGQDLYTPVQNILWQNFVQGDHVLPWLLMGFLAVPLDWKGVWNCGCPNKGNFLAFSLMLVWSKIDIIRM